MCIGMLLGFLWRCMLGAYVYRYAVRVLGVMCVMGVCV